MEKTQSTNIQDFNSSPWDLTDGKKTDKSSLYLYVLLPENICSILWTMFKETKKINKQKVKIRWLWEISIYFLIKIVKQH